MKSKLAIAALAVLISGPALMPEAALARNSTEYRHGHSNKHVYHGRHNNRHRCGGGNGAVGTVAGGVGGAVLGNAIGGGTLGTVAGGVGGALLGRHFDKKNTRSRNGC